MGSPASSACMFLGGSGILDKAVSCLWPWREVITGPTSVGLTGRQLLGQWCHGSTTPPECHTATFCQRAAQPFPSSIPYQVPPCFMAYSVNQDKVICMLQQLHSLYQGLNPKMCECCFIYILLRYFCLLSDVSQ